MLQDAINRWLEEVNNVLTKKYDTLPNKALGNGRAGEYKEDLVQAHAIFSEVYNVDPQAAW